MDCDVERDEFGSIQKYLNENPNVNTFRSYETPNGFGIITNSFDTRELLKKHPNVELKRDGQKFVIALTKEGAP